MATTMTATLPAQTYAHATDSCNSLIQNSACTDVWQAVLARLTLLERLSLQLAAAHDQGALWSQLTVAKVSVV